MYKNSHVRACKFDFNSSNKNCIKTKINNTYILLLLRLIPT